MKTAYRKFQNTGVAPGLVRRLLIAWLTSATGEFLLLPAELKTMIGLQALAARSLPRL